MKRIATAAALVVVLSTGLCVAAWVVGGQRASAEGPSHGAKDATATAAPVEDPVKAAEAAKARRADKISKLPCFGCHNFEAFRKGTPFGPPPAELPAAVSPAEAATAGSDAGGPAEPAAPNPATAAGEASPTVAAEGGTGAEAPVAATPTAADSGDEGDKPAKVELPTGTFSHFDHDEQGVGHCHSCHAFQGHFEVTIRTQTCGGCH